MSDKLGRVLVTGADGFVGENLCKFFEEKNIDYTAAVRKKDKSKNFLKIVEVGNINKFTNWKEALKEIKIVIHLAGKTTKKRFSLGEKKSFKEINEDGTENLAIQAIEEGVERFIFLSSIKVNGEITSKKMQFSPKDIPNPKDTYGISKMNAEKKLESLSKEYNIDTVIIRSPIIFGNEAKGNFGILKKFISLGIPLPFGNIKSNKRSFLSISNLNLLLLECSMSKKVIGKKILVRDDPMLSTTDLIKVFFKKDLTSNSLFNISEAFLKKMTSFLLMNNFKNKILENLEVDISETKSLMTWPPEIEEQKNSK